MNIIDFQKGFMGGLVIKPNGFLFQNEERVAGETKWSFWGLFKYSIEGIINFSQAPLALASWTGLFFTVLAVLMILFICVRKIVFGDPVAGWASMVCVTIFIGGIQLFFVPESWVNIWQNVYGSEKTPTLYY